MIFYYSERQANCNSKNIYRRLQNHSDNHQEVKETAKTSSYYLNIDKDLGLFYYSKKTAWNNQTIWEDYVPNIQGSFVKQGRSIINFVDNYSKHTIDYQQLFFWTRCE